MFRLFWDSESTHELRRSRWFTLWIKIYLSWYFKVNRSFRGCEIDRRPGYFCFVCFVGLFPRNNWILLSLFIAGCTSRPSPVPSLIGGQRLCDRKRLFSNHSKSKNLTLLSPWNLKRVLWFGGGGQHLLLDIDLAVERMIIINDDEILDSKGEENWQYSN